MDYYAALEAALDAGTEVPVMEDVIVRRDESAAPCSMDQVSALVR